MLQYKKSLWIKYKLHQSVFESINDLAYSTQTRPLGTSKLAVNEMLSHPTLCDIILPNIIGLNKNSNEWEREKLDYISNLIISVQRNGYKLNLNYTFDKSDIHRKEAITKYIEDYDLFSNFEDTKEENKDKPKIKESKSEKDIASHIINNKNLSPIDYHAYFKYEDVKDYLYWVLADKSSQVANSPEDVDKSANIRFFIFDEKKFEKLESDNLSKEISAINKLNSIKTGKTPSLLEDIALYLRVVDYQDISELNDSTEYCFSKLFKHSKDDAQSILDAISDDNIKIKAKIKRYIEVGLFTVTEDGTTINSLDNKIIGINLSQSVDWFKNPTNEGEITKLDTKYKSKK